MASIHKRPDSQYWHAAYFGPDGRRMLRSTKQQDRQSALAVAMEYERASRLARRGELVEAQAREVLKDIMKRANIGETLRNVSIEDYFKAWMDGKRTKKSKATGERYGGAVDGFLKSLGNRANKPIASLTAGDVERFLSHRMAKGLAPKTVNVDVKIIRGALNPARRDGLIPTNPAEAVELPEAVGMERGTFTPTEVKMLVDAAAGEWQTLILIAFYTGARLGDCCRMAWADVNLSAPSLTYTQAKTANKVTVPLHGDLLARLNTLAGTDKPDVFIMPGLAGKRVSGRRGLSETFKKIMKRAGVDSQTVQGAGNQMFSRRSFHALRHSFTSAMANAGVAAEVRMKLTGHKSEAIHRGYTHHEFEQLRAAVDKIPSLEK